MKRCALLVLASLLALSPLAIADDVTPVSEAPSGEDSVMRGVQGPAGMFHARVLLHVNLSSDQLGKPVSLAPDLYYSVTDRLQLGLLHNGPMGVQTRPGAGICFTGSENGCRKVYDNVGFDLLYGLAFGDFHFSAHGSLYLTQISDPTHLMLTVGGAGKFHFGGTFALFFDPQIGFAITDRDGTNADMLFIPLELQAQAADAISVKLLTGLTGPFDGFGDAYQIPLGLAAIFNLNEHFDIGLRFSFDNLLGKVPDGVSRADQRSLALLLHYRN